MDKLLLRGYVTPENCDGDVQAALDLAEKLDIRKVVLEKDYVCSQTLTVPGFTHLVIGGTLTADLQSRKTDSFSFEEDRFFIQGGKLDGNVYLYNTRRAILENLEITGNVTYVYCRDMRMEHCNVGGGITVGSGCYNGIFQNLTAGSFLISGEVAAEDVVIAKEPQIRGIVVRRSRMTAGSVQLIATADWALMNLQADEITAPETAVIIGKEGQNLPAEQYFNLTIEALDASQKLLCHNETKHAYINI